MGAGHQRQAVSVVEGLRNVLSKGVTRSSRRDSPATTIIRVRPQQVTHGALEHTHTLTCSQFPARAFRRACVVHMPYILNTLITLNIHKYSWCLGYFIWRAEVEEMLLQVWAVKSSAQHDSGLDKGKQKPIMHCRWGWMSVCSWTQWPETHLTWAFQLWRHMCRISVGYLKSKLAKWMIWSIMQSFCFWWTGHTGW